MHDVVCHAVCSADSPRLSCVCRGDNATEVYDHILKLGRSYHPQLLTRVA